MKYRCRPRRWIESRPHCVALTIHCFTKDLGNWLIFPRRQGKSFRDIDVERVRIQYLRCTPDTTPPCLYSQWSDFVDRGQCNFRRRSWRTYVCATLLRLFASFPDQRIFPKSRRLYLYDSCSRLPRLPPAAVTLIAFAHQNFASAIPQAGKDIGKRCATMRAILWFLNN